MKIIIINGANLNLLGIRETKIYGNISFEKYFEKLKKKYTSVKLEYFQSNYEGGIIDKLQKVGFSYDGILLNAGAYTHYSYAIYDAIKSIKTPVIEVHISDIKNRESFRRTSVISSACKKTIQGKGLESYDLGIDFLVK